jgi:microcystin-dependent protein
MGLFSGGTEIINNGELLEGGIPTATIVPWSNASVPSGFLECNGQAVSRSTYAALFAIIGTTYGAGDGSTTFLVPDLQDNVPVGKSNNKALASTGGANTVAVTASGNVGGSTANATLTTAQLASHSHGISVF